MGGGTAFVGVDIDDGGHLTPTVDSVDSIVCVSLSLLFIVYTNE